MPFSRRDFLLSSVIAAAAASAPAVARRATAVPVSSTSLDTGRLEALMEHAVSTRATPGVALAVWRNGKEVLSRFAGVANLETVARVDRDSVFRIGSLTKQFAGALILKLASEGKLSLSDHAHKYLPFLAGHAAFTILELLNHTAGVHDGEGDGSNAPRRSQLDLARKIALQDPFFDFPPGTAWLYSNANYSLVGAIIEQVTGESLAVAAARRLFQPLSLEHTAFDSPDEIVAGRVSGYTPTEAPDRPFQNAEYIDVSQAGAAGAMRSTVADLCRWHHALFHEGFIAAPLLSMMTTPGKLRNGKLASTHRFSANDKPMGDTQYGIGLMLDRETRDRSPIVAHHGGINGFASYLASHLPTGFTYACLCNADTHPGLPLRDVRRTVFADILRPKA